MTEDAPDQLRGRLLIAMPGMGDPRFERTVIYICSHGADGAMGLVINRRRPAVTFADLMGQLDIAVTPECRPTDVRYGGPVEMGRGFVLHSSDYHVDDATLRVDENVSLTATLEVLRAMATGTGPRKAMIALGYSGWAPHQLETELQRNGWLTCEADEDLLYSPEDGAKWGRALAKLGVAPSMLSAVGGSA
jgi:putative transcriptional regulator